MFGEVLECSTLVYGDGEALCAAVGLFLLQEIKFYKKLMLCNEIVRT